MIENWLAKTISQVGIAPFDYFSIGHIGMGIGFLFALHLIYSFIYSKKLSEIEPKHLGFMVALSFILGIAWEVWENIITLKLGVELLDKTNRVDSIANFITDMIFVTTGASAMAYLSYLFKNKGLNLTKYYLAVLLVFGLILGLFFLGRHFTLF